MGCTKHSKSWGKALRGGLVALALAGCAAEPRDPMQTIRDGLFYDGLAAYHEGFYKEAAARWERATQYGDGEAARNLGHLYRQGLGVEQDAAIALAWYQVAADAGVVSAQYNLGMLYLKGGPNLAPNRQAGLLWLNKAAAAGLLPAQAELERQTRAPVAAEPPPPPPLPPPPLPTTPDPPPWVEPPARTVRMQIGSYRSLVEAKADWSRVRNPGLRHEIVPVSLKDRGRWFRLLVVGGEDEMAVYCQGLLRHGLACWPGNPR